MPLNSLKNPESGGPKISLIFKGILALFIDLKYAIPLMRLNKRNIFRVF